MNVVGKHRSAQPTHQTKLPGSGNSSSSNIRPFSHDLSDNVLSTMQVKAAAAAIGKPATYVYSISFQTTSTGMSLLHYDGFPAHFK